MSLPHEIAEQQARCDEYNKMREPEFDYSSPLNFLLSVFKNEEVPLHTRLRAASEACKYSTPQLKAVAHVTANSNAAAIDRARERCANLAKVIRLETAPKAIEHSAAELKPPPNGGFKRRI
jgi:hypothetical protein